MSATLQNIHDLAFGGAQLRQRFLAARLKAAWDVLNEDAQAPNHAARLAWAEKVLANPEADAQREYLRFLSNTTIQAWGGASTDNDVQFVVNSFVDANAAIDAAVAQAAQIG